MNDLEAWASIEVRLALALRSSDREAALSRLRAELALGFAGTDAPPEIHGDGFRIAALLVARLRFERMLQGSKSLGACFEADPEGLMQRFKRYHDALPMQAESPSAEARSFEHWSRAQAMGG